MCVVLLATGILLTGIFGMHRRAVEALILAEGLERLVYYEEVPETERGISRGKAEESFSERLRGFYGCGRAEVSFSGKKEDLRIRGVVTDDTVTEISVPNYDPEKRLRRMKAIADILKQEEQAGEHTVSEGDQP